MARKNDLAKLAALAGLGMVLTNQYRNKVDLTEKDSNPDRKARPDSTENRLESQEETIKRSMKKAPLDDSRTDAASSGDEMSKYAAKNKSRTNTAFVKPAKVNNQPPLVITKELEALPVNQSDKSLIERNPPIVLKKEQKNLPNKQSGKTIEERNPPLPIPNSMKNLANVPTNFGKLVNPYPADNKAATNEAVKQAAISATKKHDEAEKKVKDGRYKQMDANILNNMITNPPMKKGGAVKMASGGMTASRRGDGIATKGKTRGKIC